MMRAAVWLARLVLLSVAAWFIVVCVVCLGVLGAWVMIG